MAENITGEDVEEETVSSITRCIMTYWDASAPLLIRFQAVQSAEEYLPELLTIVFQKPGTKEVLYSKESLVVQVDSSKGSNTVDSEKITPSVVCTV